MNQRQSQLDNDSEAEARLPVINQLADGHLSNHNREVIQSREEADSSTASVNDNISIEFVDISGDNEAEAHARDNGIKSVPLVFKDTIEEEEASGSNITDNDNEEPIKLPCESNPYAYLNREEFSSERYKIEISGLPKHFGVGQLKKLLNDKLQLKAHKIKPPPNFMGHAYITFRSEDDRIRALESLNGYVWKKSTLSAVTAKPVQDPLVRKRTYQQMCNDDDSEVAKLSAKDLVKKATAPWSEVPYEQQLERKMSVVNDIVKLIYRSMANVNGSINPNEICKIEPILPSPLQKKYRNKCEFTIGYNPDTNEKTVGFRIASYKKGSTAVGPVDDLPHIPDTMINVVNSFQTFIRTSEPDFDPYNPETHEGLWKQLTIRVAQNEVMVVLLINGRKLDAQLLENIKTSIKDYYSSDQIISSFLLKVAESSGETEKNKPQLIFGNGYITEELMGLKFKISAEAFFQVNTPAAEVLYENIKKEAKIDSETSVLDVCCGTGTIGLCLANDCAQVIGIEMNEDAVADAKANSELNGLHEKSRYYAGRAENVLEAIFGMNTYHKLVAIVDPPRAGIHNKVIHTLRRNENFDKLIYVSCDAKAALKNFVDLSRPTSKNYKGEYFIPTKFIPVDLFPDSPHFELIIVFERKIKPVVNDAD